jgi:hypothetical protein
MREATEALEAVKRLASQLLRLASGVDLSQACPCFADPLLCGPYLAAESKTDGHAVFPVEHILGAFKSAFGLVHVLPGTRQFEIKEFGHHPVSVS